MALGFASALAAGSMEVARGVVVVGYDDAAVTAGLTRTESMMRRGGAGGLARGVLGIGAAFGIVAGMSGRMAINFQNQMRLIQTSAGATGKDVQILTKQILDLAKSGQSPYGPTELSRAMFHLKSIGYDNVTAMGILRAAVQGAKIGFADLETTTSALGAAMRAIFGSHGTVEQARQTMGVLNGIVGSGNMRLQDLISSLGTGVVGAATAVGLKLTDVGAALAVLVDQGQNANMAATRMRMSFSLLGAPTKKAATELATIGLGAKDLLRQLGSGNQGLLRALELLKQHLAATFDLSTKVGREDAFAVLSKAFGGGRSAGSIMILLNHLELLRQKYGQIGTIAKRTNAEIAASNKTAAVQISEAWAKIQADFMQFGNAVLPVIAGFAKGIAKVADFISSHSQFFAAFATVLGLIGLQMLAVSMYSRLAGIGLAIATTGMSKAGASAAIAAGEVSVLRGFLLGLATLGVITIVVDILFRPKGPTDWLKKNIPDYKRFGDWVDSKVPFLRHVDEAHGLLAPGEGGRPMGANPYQKGSALYRAWAAGAEGHKIAPRDLSIAAAKAWEQGHLWRKKLDARPHAKPKAKGSTIPKIPAIGPGSGTGKKGPATPIPIQTREAIVNQTGNLPKEIHALDAERQWIEHVLATDKKLTPVQRLDLEKRLAVVDKKIAALYKREHAALGRSKAMTFPNIAISIAKAKSDIANPTPNGAALNADLFALTGEQKWLKRQIANGHNSKKRLKSLYDELTKVQREINAIRKAGAGQIAKEAMAFIALRGSFWGDFAPDVFHQNAKGKLELGSERGSSPVHHHKHVNVHQTNHYPTGETHAPLHSARFAAEAAF